MKPTIFAFPTGRSCEEYDDTSNGGMNSNMQEHKAMQSWEAIIRWRHENRQGENHELDWPLLKLEELKKFAD